MTQLVLGVGHGPELLAGQFRERHQAVMRTIAAAIRGPMPQAGSSACLEKC